MPINLTGRCGVSRGDVVAGWLIKVVVMLGLAGLVLIEVGGVLFARYVVTETASSAASEAGFAIRTKQPEGGQAVAERVAEAKGCRLTAISADEAAQTVTVTVQKTAKTLLIQNIKPLKKFTVATATQTTSYASI